ncbi:MAG: gliding motility lipoprotein GldH [Flammeovirgaceae bacterium]|nr:gliding motility lipoprotein GldH [Flammeovirgaceae bacterium]
MTLRLIAFALGIILFCSACDSTRVFEQNQEFEDRVWPIGQLAEFSVTIDSDTLPYNLYYNVRNTSDYPNARIFLTYYLLDSTGTELESKLIDNFLFDLKTGKPLGSSGIGDLFDHRFIFWRPTISPIRENIL